MHDRNEPRPTPPRGGGALPHLAIEHVTPVVDDGRFAPKRILGELCEVAADIFKDGHDTLRSRVRYRGPDDERWRYAPLAYDKDVDRWFGAFELDAIGAWQFTVEAWTDVFSTWRGKLEKKVGAGQDVAVELLEAVQMVREATHAAEGEAKRKLDAYAALLADDANAQRTKVEAALAPELLALMEAHHPPGDLTTFDRELPLRVDRERAAFAAWYEFFPRSASAKVPCRPSGAAERGNSSYHDAKPARSRSTHSGSSRS